MKIVRPRKKVYPCRISAHLEINLDHFNQGQIYELKRSLTFDNPAYRAAQRYSPWGVTAISPSLMYYQSRKGVMTVPHGTSLDCLGYPPVEDLRVEVPIKAPKFKLQLRDDQQAAADAYLEKNQTATPNGLIQMPTGKGKTITALYIASQLGQRTLVIVHKDDLVLGWQKDIQLCFGSKCAPGLIKAKSRRVGDFITIATVQTLSRMSDEEREQYLSMFGFVVCDEVHHCPASSFSIVDDFTARYRLGLTATPERKDGLAHVMWLYFGGFCYKYESKPQDEDILPVRVIRRSADFLRINPVCEKVQDKNQWFIKDLRTDPMSYKLKDGEQFISDVPYGVRPRIPFGDYSDLVVRRMLDFVLQDIQAEYKKGHSCIVFLSQKQQVDDFAEYLHTRMKVPSSDVLKYYGDNSAKENASVLAHAEKHRKCITIATYSKATEGTNCRQWEVAFLVSSIADAKNTEQAAGRIRRVKEGKLPVALIYDYRCPYVYSLSSHANIRDARYRKLGFTFEADPTLKKKSVFTRGYSR